MKPGDGRSRESEAQDCTWVDGAGLDKWIEGGDASLAHWPIDYIKERR